MQGPTLESRVIGDSGDVSHMFPPLTNQSKLELSRSRDRYLCLPGAWTFSDFYQRAPLACAKRAVSSSRLSPGCARPATPAMTQLSV